MIFAELISPNCWVSAKKPVLLLPYPQALRSELRCSDGKRAVGFLLDVGEKHPTLLRVCSESEDEMSRYVETGRWRKGTTFEKADHTKADLKAVAWFGEDLMSARKKIPEPYATHLGNFLSELLARGMKIS